MQNIIFLYQRLQKVWRWLETCSG